MSDTTVPGTGETTEPGEPAEKTAVPEGTPPVDWQAEAEKWKAHSRKNEARAKENADAAARLAEIEAAQLSEAEKLTKRAEEAERRLAEAEVTALKASVAADKGVPAELISGATKEELVASADALLAFRGPAQTTDFGAGRPGVKDIGDGKAQQITREQLKTMTAQEIVAAKADGRLADLLGQS